MLLTVNRITPHEKKFSIRLSDDKFISFDDPTYIIKRYVELTNTLDYELKINLIKGHPDVTLSYDALNLNLDIIDEVPKNGCGYRYVVERNVPQPALPDGSIPIEVTHSNDIYVESIPSKINNFSIIDVATIYDDITAIPTQITLGWDAFDYEDNNPDVLGIEFYYSESPKGIDEWSAYTKVTNHSTTPVGNITRINKALTSTTIDVPQLLDARHPKDIKLIAVAVTSNTQSYPSEHDSIATHNMASAMYFSKIGFATMINGTKEDTEKQINDYNLHNPYFTIEFEDAFSEDAFAWCERRVAYEYDKNDNITIDYSIGATKEILKPYKVSIYLPLPRSYSYTITALNGSKTPIPSEYDAKTQMLSFSYNTHLDFKLYAKNTEKNNNILVYEETFRETTRKLIKRLPTWFKIRRNPVGSVGAYFLDVFGVELEEIEKLLEYAADQTHSLTLDETQLTQIYKVQLPDTINEKDRFAVIGSNAEVLERCDSLSYFLKPPYFLSEEKMIYHNLLFLIDYKEKLLYLRKSFEVEKDAPFGKVRVHIYKDGEEESWYNSDLTLKPHKLWNFYDEFGLLLDTPRLKGETNKDYKDRILDVFKNPASSTRIGLLNGIARELGIRKTLLWNDTSKDLIIKDSMVVCNCIRVNGKILPVNKVWIDLDDNIIIKADKDLPDEVEVSYVSGIEMHALNNKEDRDLQNQLFQANGLATTLLLQYVKRVKDKIPVEWDSFRWNEGYWDANLAENGGIAFVPAIMDASISGLTYITPDEKRGLQHYKK